MDDDGSFAALVLLLPGHQVWGELPLAVPGDVLVPVPVVAHHVRGRVRPVGVPTCLHTHRIYISTHYLLGHAAVVVGHVGPRAQVRGKPSPSQG